MESCLNASYSKPNQPVRLELEHTRLLKHVPAAQVAVQQYDSTARNARFTAVRQPINGETEEGKKRGPGQPASSLRLMRRTFSHSVGKRKRSLINVSE